ncbi:hypothetical protein BS50DRAFT_278749 [Corynespora cassiicola Philippines]|uniref:Uncharacterized protein n=1 Tax=Corynespora cassiicola Philippines TaxID=1448308 RepID=A0A2T2P0P0_CORCC|nr:hypothetical protein BS50DRAFT_278749 [Corynespora cassiicola Philippines]
MPTYMGGTWLSQPGPQTRRRQPWIVEAKPVVDPRRSRQESADFGPSASVHYVHSYLPCSPVRDEQVITIHHARHPPVSALSTVGAAEMQ